MPHDTIAAYSDADQRRILAACPPATEISTFHGWLAAGRVVSKGQRGIRLVAPDQIADGGKLRSIKAVYVFDVTQTQERTPSAAAAWTIPQDAVWGAGDRSDTITDAAALGFGSGPQADVS